MNELELVLQLLTGTGPYNTKKDLCVEIATDGFLQIAGNFPGFTHPEIIVETNLHCRLNKGIELLSLKTVDDIDAVSSNRLLELYLEGEAEVFCCVDQIKILYLRFKKKGSGTVVFNDDDNSEHEINQLLQTPADFINYTCTYFGIGDAKNNNY